MHHASYDHFLVAFQIFLLDVLPSLPTHSYFLFVIYSVEAKLTPTTRQLVNHSLSAPSADFTPAFFLESQAERQWPIRLRKARRNRTFLTHIMPFLGFVRSSSHDGHPTSTIKDSLRKITAKGPSTSTLSVQTGLFGQVEDFPVMDGVKRHSIGAKLSVSRRGSATSPKVQPSKSARLWLTVESPPLVCINPLLES